MPKPEWDETFGSLIVVRLIWQHLLTVQLACIRFADKTHEVCQVAHIDAGSMHAGGCGRPNHVGHMAQGRAPKVFSVELAWQSAEVQRTKKVLLEHLASCS